MYELKMMREVVHPNILEILEIYEGDNNIYCLGRLYKGENLSSIIGDRKYILTEQHVINMIVRMLQVD